MVETVRFPLPDESATCRLARGLARLMVPGDVVALAGDLGAGKTALARALIRDLTDNPDEEVPSPTFTLVQTYDTAPAPVWHFDLYRLSVPDECLELGWDEAVAGGIVLVEWPERLGALLPAVRLDVVLSFDAAAGPDARLAVLSGRGGDWGSRLTALTLGDAG